MWPSFLYMSKEESIKNLRQLELDAYSLLVSVFRAQGPLTQEKRKILRDTSRFLNITVDRHKTEVRRAVNDEKLNTIAYHIHGPGISSEDWCQEGRRVLPMLQRISPQTLHPIITDTFSGSALQQNYQEMRHSNFERKKLPGKESETVLKKSEKMDYSQALTNDGDTTEDSKDNSASCNTDYPSKHRPLITKSSFYKQSYGSANQDPEKVTKIYPNKKLANKNQHLVIVSKTQTIPTNSILHKTLSVPMSKVTTLNLDKFKIVSSSTLPPSIHVSSLVSSENASSSKHTFLTGKSGKKVIPLSQLQMLNHKLGSKGGIKVLPLNSKLFGKNITVTRITPVSRLNNTLSVTLAAHNKDVTLESGNKTKEKEEYDETNIINDNDKPNKKSDDFKTLENAKKSAETTPKIKTEKEDDGNFGTEVGEENVQRIKKTDGEELRTEETKSEDYITEETQIGDIKGKEIEKGCFKIDENNDYSIPTENERRKVIPETKPAENLKGNEEKSCKADDDLAALMEIDSSEFIEPELKDSLIVKREL